MFYDGWGLGHKCVTDSTFFPKVDAVTTHEVCHPLTTCHLRMCDRTGTCVTRFGNYNYVLPTLENVEFECYVVRQKKKVL